MAESVRVGYQDTVECDSCDGTENVYHYCIQCPGNICDTCKLTHCNTRLTKNHRILPRTHPEVQQSRLSKKVYCELHHDKEYVNFCAKCHIPCCPTCISNEHSGHIFSDLGDEISKVEKEMNETASNLETNIIPEVERAIGSMNKAISDYEKSADKVNQSAKGKIEQLHKDVERAGRQFLDALEAQKERDIARMQQIRKELTENLSDMKAKKVTFRTAPADASLLFKREKFKGTMDTKLRSVQFPGCLTFQVSKTKPFSNEQIIGNLLLGHTITIEGTRGGSQVRNPIHFDQSRIGISVLANIQRSGGRINHTSDGQTWISDNYSQSISKYDEKFRLIGTIDVDCKLEDMAVTKNKDVIATSSYSKCILRISSSQGISTMKKLAPNSACGICINDNQQIVVGVGSPWKLLIFSSDLYSKLNEIEKDDNGKALFTNCIRRVRQTFNGEYLVATGSTVICLSNDWKVKWELKLASTVWGLCYDRFHNTLVVDRDSNEIVILDSHGQVIQTLASKKDGISQPLTVSVDKNDLLWIGQERNTKVIRYLKE